ncbi:MAG: single-stranded-DNA-specific exonuclease RecJ [Roseimicrobium sp.]
MTIFSAPRARWILQEPESQSLVALSQSPLGVALPPLIRRLLALRSLTGEAAMRSFLQPRLADLSDPFALPDMRLAVERIFTAIARQEHIVLYGDYDVDGVTSLTIMTLVLRAYGANPHCFLPLRMGEGYGLSHDGLERCFEEHGKPQLLIAMDCGTGSVAEVAWLRDQGVECIIVDHHEPGEARPDCVALVNPKVGSAMTYFCTAGLAFKLAHALLKERRLESFDLREHLDLVALGTVADLVPLMEENRTLVRKGLEKLGETTKAGLCALKVIAGLDGAIQAPHIGFRLGPRLNAAGRLDTAQTALDLLLCEDPAEARECAELLDAHNRERQHVEETVRREAAAMLEADPTVAEGPCIVLGSRAWHSGVVGIVASRIMREFHRPTVLIAFDEHGLGRGSGRSVPGVSLVEALNRCRHLLAGGGGHDMAVGLSLPEENFAAFRHAMREAVASLTAVEGLSPLLELEAEIRLAELVPEFYRHYLHLEPFGMGNPEPIFLCRRVEPQLPGTVLKERHWKLLLRQGAEVRPAMWFNAPIAAPPTAPWDVAFKLQRHLWRGQESWQLMICAVREAE